MATFIGCHPRRSIGFVVVHTRVGAFTAFDEWQYCIGGQPARSSADQPGAHAGPPGSRDGDASCLELARPMGGVPALDACQVFDNLASFTRIGSCKTRHELSRTASLSQQPEPKPHPPM